MLCKRLKLQLYQANGILSQIQNGNEAQIKLFKIVEEVFEKPLLGEGLKLELQTSIRLGSPVAKEVQDFFEIYQVIRSELVKQGVDIAESHVTGPLILRRITFTT